MTLDGAVRSAGLALLGLSIYSASGSIVDSVMAVLGVVMFVAAR